jgi:hypothetical protein
MLSTSITREINRRGATEVECLSHALAAHRQVY